MGCAGSKNESALGRLSSYQIAAAQAETEGFTQSPLPLVEEETAAAAHGVLIPFHFHNIFYDGFYAPYIRNPDYLLVVDTREKEGAYELSHVVTAQWYGHLSYMKPKGEAREDDDDRLSRYCHVVLYDADGSGLKSEDSTLGRIAKFMKERHVEPLFLEGGFQNLSKSCPHLVIIPPDGSKIPMTGSRLALSWFPSIVLDGQLFLGRREQAADPAVLAGLQVTHIVCVADSSSSLPAPLSPSLNYLVVPLPPEATEDNKDDNLVVDGTTDQICNEKSHSGNNGGKSSKTSKVSKDQKVKNVELGLIDLAAQLPTLTAFVQDALKGDNAVPGRVLISGEQGVNRSAALVMAFLMKDRACTLEDAYYYVKRCRPAVQLSETLLRSLAHLESNIFGRGVTNIEDLGY